jgi:serine/threonine-protein kinase
VGLLAKLLATVSDSPSSRLGQIVGNYRLVRILGEGGVGTVYEAVHTQLGRKMAIKLLHKDVVSRETVTRFFNEARAVNEIRHPNIIDVEDFVITPAGEHYMLMELLEGEDLRTVITREKQLDPARVAAIGEQVASALGAVHRVGIIHRDLKPDNIFLMMKDGREVAKLLDFGIAKFQNEQQGVTRAGMTMGTPHYMAPEQIITGRENDLGNGSDIYALGMVLYEALTGAPAFNSPATAQILRAHCFEPVDPPSKRRASPVPPVLEAVIMKCLEKERGNRFPTAEDMCAALRAQVPVRLSGKITIAPPINYESVRTRKSRVVVMLPAFAMAAAALAIQLWPRDRGAIAATPPVEPKPAIVVVAPPEPKPEKPKPPSVTLELASQPEGAEIAVDGNVVGVAPIATSLVMSSDIVTLVARFPDGVEVTQTVVPDRPSLPTITFTKPNAGKPMKHKPPPAKHEPKKDPPTSTIQNRDGTMDPFKK